MRIGVDRHILPAPDRRRYTASAFTQGTHSKMDITSASGAEGPGSIPGGCILFSTGSVSRKLDALKQPRPEHCFPDFAAGNLDFLLHHPIYPGFLQTIGGFLGQQFWQAGAKADPSVADRLDIASRVLKVDSTNPEPTVKYGLNFGGDELGLDIPPCGS